MIEIIYYVIIGYILGLYRGLYLTNRTPKC